MPSKKKKYNARFPAGRIKKIMQTDEEVGKVAQAVPVIISRTLELFVESLLTKAMEITNAKNAKTLSPSHMKQCILSESRFDFLKDLVASLPDVTACDSEDGAGQINASTQPPSNSVGKSDTSGSRRQHEGSITNKEDRGRVAPALEVSSRMNPNFYKENEDVSISNNENFGHHANTPSHAQHSHVYPNTPEVLEIEDSADENEEECKPPVIVPQYVQTQAGTVVDEDYDT